MRRLTSILIVCVLGLALMALSNGCAPGAARNDNGDRGSLLTVMAKLGDPNNNIGALNSAELQIFLAYLPSLAEQFPQLGIVIPPGVEMPQLSDSEAESLETFLDANNVNTFADIGALALLVQAGQVEVPDDLTSFWAEFIAQFDQSQPA